ncbi:MAG: GNAT family N-acetyltransferase [Hyphomicrobium sp.]
MTTHAYPPDGSIRKLLATENDLFSQHLLRLDKESRRLRFTHAVSDEFVRNYAKTASDPGSVVYIYTLDGVVRAAAELKRNGATWGHTAEAAFSVESKFANKGLATELMGHIILSARNRGVHHLVMNCLAENLRMQAIARKYHAELHLEHGDVTADIIPKRFDYISLATEIFEDRFILFLSALDHQARRLKKVA